MLTTALQQPLVIASLVAAPLVYLGGLALGRWLKREQRVPLGTIYHLFCLGLAIYLPVRALYAATVPDLVVPGTSEGWQTRWLRYFSSTLILLGIAVLLALLRRFYWQRWFKKKHEDEAPKLLQQVFSVAAFTIALMLVLNLRHGQQVDAFLAGSGIVAVVLGFAMQETLANIISGIALQVGKPFKVGDWLIVEKTRAEVVEMNWRSIRLRTNDDIYLDIPNKTVTSGMITNLSYPTKSHAQRIRVRFEQTAPPNVVREVLRRAAANAPGVLSHPPVKVFLVEFIDYAALYEIKYSLDEAGRFNDIEDGIRTNIWYEAQRANLVIPAPGQNLFLRREAPATPTIPSVARDILKNQELFAPLTEDQQRRLIAGAHVLRFGRGERIITQDDEGHSMFMVLAGEVDVVVHAKGKDLPVAKLKAGDAFGEMCLLTGEKRTANVVAHGDCDVWEIHRDVIAPLLQENPEFTHRLSDLLAHRKMQTEGLLAAQAPHELTENRRKEYAHGFFRRLSSLFEI